MEHSKYTKKVASSSLSSLHTVLVDTIVPHNLFISEARNYLLQYGLGVDAIITPLLSLPEMGGVIVAMKDRLAGDNNLLNLPISTSSLREGGVEILRNADRRRAIHLMESGFPVYECMKFFVLSDFIRV
jgi:hypothetical protein